MLKTKPKSSSTTPRINKTKESGPHDKDNNHLRPALSGPTVMDVKYNTITSNVGVSEVAFVEFVTNDVTQVFSKVTLWWDWFTALCL